MRTRLRIGPTVFIAALAAALASGCAPLRGTLLGPDTPPPKTPGVVPADGFAGGTVVSAGAAVPAQPVGPMPPPVAPAVPDPLASPRPLPAPGAPIDPLMVPPGVPTVPGSKFGTPIPADPHFRTTPTATGGRLALAPHEMTTDRVVELTLHLERMVAHNATLAARVKELENAAAGREQALEEASRALAAANAETERVRAALQAQVVRLQGRIRELEEEDIAFLRAVIEALGRLAPPERKP